jgi:cellulose synthase/poly-beta-1,6-N-acetylglucosamine synthase-like glycosyltransferase
MSALSFLRSLDATSAILLFWYTIVLEIPRYTIGAVVVCGISLWKRPTSFPIWTDLTLNVILAGHNEEKPLRASIEALAEQTILATRGPIEVIVVDDGSTDRMFEVAKDLQREGKIDSVSRLEHRGGKSAASISVFPPAPAILSSFPTSTPLSIEAHLPNCSGILPTRAWAPSAAASAYVMHPPASSPATRPSNTRSALRLAALSRIRLEFFRSCRVLLVRSAVPHWNKSVDRTLK